MVFTIGPHHDMPNIPIKVNSFHLLPSLDHYLNGILLEPTINCMTRSMTVMPSGCDKDEPGAKTPKHEAWKRRSKKLLKPDRSLRPSHRSLRTTPEFPDRPPVRTQEPSPGQSEGPSGDDTGD